MQHNHTNTVEWKIKRKIFVVFLLFTLLLSHFMVPFIGYKIWHHHHRIWFKNEAVNYYKDRPELFVTFQLDKAFEQERQILKPQKEFAIRGLKYDILDTLQNASGLAILCVQDADENALAALIGACTPSDQRDPNNIPMQEWYKIFKSTWRRPLELCLFAPTFHLEHDSQWTAPISHWDLDIPNPPPPAGPSQS